MIRRVLTENGWVRGLPAADPRITSYKGIPFAAPPVGKNRWRAPQPCENWMGELFAADFAPIPMQAQCAVPQNFYFKEWAVDPDLEMSEDCLYLNIWAPADGRRDMPVFVWYFGGALQVGSTAEMEFDGERIARRGVVVVTVGYRLNSFGFLCHPQITKEQPDAPANFGLLDQQFATRWVKRNIAAFGGDPNNITIGGQSAGGMSVSAQMTCAENKGLFQRAIIESGTIIPPYPPDFGLCKSFEEAQAQGERFFEYLGVRTLEEARSIDAQTLNEKTLAWTRDPIWGEVVDGKFCVEDSQTWFLQPQRVICPVLMGQTSSEFCADPPEDIEAFAKEKYGADAEMYLSFFKKPRTKESVIRDGRVQCIDYTIRAAAEAPHDVPYYLYNFDADIPGFDHPGTFHSVDLWFFFETLAKCWRSFTGAHYDLARSMCDYWVNFMRTGDPNGIDLNGNALPEWKAYTKEHPNMMRFTDRAEAKEDAPQPLMRFLLDHFGGGRR